MYEVTYVLDGVQKKMIINANDGILAQKCLQICIQVLELKL